MDRRRICASGFLFVTLVAAAAFRSSSGIFLVPVSDEFGWSREVVSLAITVQLFFYGLTAPFAAALMEKFGVRRVAASALVGAIRDPRKEVA